MTYLNYPALKPTPKSKRLVEEEIIFDKDTHPVSLCMAATVVTTASLRYNDYFGQLNPIHDHALLRARGYFGEEKYSVSTVRDPRVFGKEGGGETNGFDRRHILQNLPGYFNAAGWTSNTFYDVFYSQGQALAGGRRVPWDNLIFHEDPNFPVLSVMPLDIERNACLPVDLRRSDDRYNFENYQASQQIIPKNFPARRDGKIVDYSRWISASWLEDQPELRHYAMINVFLAGLQHDLMLGRTLATLISHPGLIKKYILKLGLIDPVTDKDKLGEVVVMDGKPCQFAAIPITEGNIKKLHRSIEHFGPLPMVCHGLIENSQQALVLEKQGHTWSIRPQFLFPNQHLAMFSEYYKSTDLFPADFSGGAEP